MGVSMMISNILGFLSDFSSTIVFATRRVVFNLCMTTIRAPDPLFVKCIPASQSGSWTLNLNLHGPEGERRCETMSEVCSSVAVDADGGMLGNVLSRSSG